MRPSQRRTRHVVIAIGILRSCAVAVPGLRVTIVVLGGVLVTWAVFGLLTD